MKPVVLFRSDKWSADEKEVCKKHFPVADTRMRLPTDSLVIGRYSVLPFYYELQQDLETINSKLINSHHEHRYIANFDWYYDIENLTPKTFFDTTEASRAFNDMPHGMILKGRTNSAKSWEWMYAKTKDDFYRIDKFLHQHEMIAAQGVVYREYVPLDIIEKSAIANSFNFVNEWRCFFYKKELLSFGYYWTMASDEAIERANSQNMAEMLDVAGKASKELAKHTNFFVVDVAKTAEGAWIVIEVNDGQMSGLSMCDENILYSNLSFLLNSERSEHENENINK